MDSDTHSIVLNECRIEKLILSIWYFYLRTKNDWKRWKIVIYDKIPTLFESKIYTAQNFWTSIFGPEILCCCLKIRFWNLQIDYRPITYKLFFSFWFNDFQFIKRGSKRKTYNKYQIMQIAKYIYKSASFIKH